MKKKKSGFILSIVSICLSIFAIAFGVYSLTTAKLNISGSIGFTVHDCKLSISAYMYGHALTADGKPTTLSNKTYLIDKNNSEATEESPYVVCDNDSGLSFNINKDSYKGVYFSNLSSTGTVEPITIVINLTNISKDVVCFEDATTVASNAQYEITPSTTFKTFYASGDQVSGTITYTIMPKANSDGTYSSITAPVDVSLGMSFSKINTSIASNGYTVNETSKAITGVPAKAADAPDYIVIPSVFSDKTDVTFTTLGSGSSISNIADYKNVVILEGITDIRQSAFFDCKNIKNVALPDGLLTFGGDTFYNCTSLTSITIPSSVTTIGYAAFSGCTSLTSITIPSSVTKLNDATFSGCTSLTTITIPSSVTTIELYVFDNCTSLTSITIPDSVTSINAPFKGCTSLTNITVDSGNPVYDSRNNCNAIIKTSSNTLIVGSKSSTIPSTVTAIGYNAFHNRTRLRSITIPSSVTEIGGHAFDGCTSLTSITIPSSVTTIGSGAFQGCTSLTSITIPSGVTKLNEETFYNCTSLTTITIPSTVTAIGYNAFNGCTSLTSITIPSSVTEISNSAFYGCTSLTNITVDSRNTVYDSRDNCNAIIEKSSNTLIVGCKSSTIPSTVTAIGSNAFYNCTSLTSITIPSSVTTIGYAAFSGCTSLTSITIPSSVTLIKTSVFSNCQNLTNISFEKTDNWKYSTDYGRTYKELTPDSLTDSAKNAINFKGTWKGYYFSNI